MTALAPVAATAQADASGVTVTSHFVVADDTVIDGDTAFLNNGATNNLPHAIVFMALNDTPGGVCGCAIVRKPLGVWYDPESAEWGVFVEDATAMPAEPSFNILVAQKPSASVFVHFARASNTQGNHTFINSKLLNGNPRASIQITQNFNPGGCRMGTRTMSRSPLRFTTQAGRAPSVTRTRSKSPTRVPEQCSSRRH